MTREATSDCTMGATPEGTRYGPDRAEGVLASERTVLRLITRNTPLPELLDEVCRIAVMQGGYERVVISGPTGANAMLRAARPALGVIEHAQARTAMSSPRVISQF